MPEIKLRDKFSASSRFLKSDIWRIQARKLSRRKLSYINPLRVLLLAIRRFFENKCELRASALTFYTLLSIVPVVAMAFGVAKGFGLEKTPRIPAARQTRGTAGSRRSTTRLFAQPIGKHQGRRHRRSRRRGVVLERRQSFRQH